MADITSVQAIAFSDAYIRTQANKLGQLYWLAKETVGLWSALGMSSTIANTADVILDGADTDGRPIITGAKATAVINLLSAFITDYEASTNSKLNSVLQVASNPNP